ncbi:hypothetical protein CLAFUW4_12009 [Fulvia fulva]|uniref:Peptidase M3A/M3B catalytic domain-containing protein n=1 Tax=Passalora fulva TaxID=5499 RepID=A0A9Q8PEB9_PASFU|nr:uncharacterized protein CLAFUR5_11048 [Fulvia fulva]KAK4618330.1 hypothetical protein CLAFUR4_12014 [Fulvia fulva]KAK4619141.1 hypothetical protein CLAFUR0_12025 [Fulvia fulva]UJO20946.1 hypothetical protein CLAFUR5_11048 [Fulvia fulva]WPV18560.1 hypothetical protein CLAFUW4_12009 [Fulvia fulva]WPV32975.1 hypothetical protein CLAFUW7_12016 [Fulvia fulva]
MNRVPHNIPLHRELILLRDDTARLLGWANHFEFKTSQKMVQTPAAVLRLLSEVRAALRPVAERSAHELLLLKVEESAAHGAHMNSDKLFFWDKAYFEKNDDIKRSGNNQGPPLSEYFELNDLDENVRNIRANLRF